MPPTPTRQVQKGGGRQRQGSSLLPQNGHGIGGGDAAGFSSVQPYPTVGRAVKGATGVPEFLTAPFVHPALALASGISGTQGGLSSSSAAALSSATAAQSRGRRPFNHRNLFARDLRNLMYAYGDAPNPEPDSVTLLEEMTVDFITDLCCRARPSPYALGLGTSAVSNSSSAFGATLEQQSAEGIPEPLSQTLPPRAPHRLRVKLEDFRHALRKDVEAKKLGRMEQLLYADRVVSEARRVGGVEEAAERAGALQTDNLPPATAAGPSQDTLVDEDDAEDNETTPTSAKRAKSKPKGTKASGQAKSKPKIAASPSI